MRESPLPSAVFALAVGALFTHCKPAATVSPPDAAPPLRVQTEPARARTLHRTRTFFGSIVSEQQATVSALVSGRVEQRFVDRGDRVRAGDPLFRVRDNDYRDQSAQAAAALSQAQARSGADSPEVRVAQIAADTADEALRRVETLATQGSASQQDLTRARADARSARAQLTAAQQGSTAARFATAQARAQLAVSRRAVGDAVVRAPFDGEVLERRVDVGDFVVQGTVALVLLRRDAMRVRFDVPQAEALSLHAGQSAQVSVDGIEALTLPAQLRYVSPALNERARSLTVEATLDRVDPRVRPGQFATVRVELDGTVDRVAVARRALRSLAGIHRAYVVHERRLQERVLFVPDEIEGDEVLVERGITAGESVVMDPPMRAADGVEVTQ